MAPPWHGRVELMTDEWWDRCRNAGGVDVLAEQSLALYQQSVKGERPPRA
jgi:hypothetical protein